MGLFLIGDELGLDTRLWFEVRDLEQVVEWVDLLDLCRWNNEYLQWRKWSVFIVG